MLTTGGYYLPGMAILKQYGNRLKLIVCKVCRVSGWENDAEIRGFLRGAINDEKLECNIARARSSIFELAMCNPWEYFVTLTIDAKKYDRHNLGEYYQALAVFLMNYRRTNGCKIQYLFIPEPHQDGAWHMHGFLNGLSKDKLELNAQGYLDWPDYRKKFGYISLGAVRDSEAAAWYITKYISKDLAARKMDLNAHLYYCSKGLQRAKVIKKGPMAATIDPDYENDFVKVRWYDVSDLESASSMILD